MFNYFNFETQLNLDDQCMDIEPQMKVKQLPTTANNSPGSLKSSCQNYALDLHPTLDNSFEQGCQTHHARNILDSSLNLYNQGVIQMNQSLTGFNDQKCYSSTAYSHQSEHKNIDEAIKSNRLLRFYQKANFIEELQSESELSTLLVELMVLFNPKIFSELVYIIHTIWNKRYLNFRQSKVKQQSVIPQFNSFFGFDNYQIEKQEISINSSQTKQIVEKSQQELEELVDQLFNSKKLKYLNFKQIKGNKKHQQILKEHFYQFISTVSRTVFLSAEGVYEEESVGAESVSIPSFFEQEEEEVSQLDEGMNKFARAYSQLQQADEECSFSSQLGRKRVKLD